MNSGALLRTPRAGGAPLLLSLLLWIGVAQAAQAPHSTVLPGVGARDPRVVVDIRTAPWNGLVRLQVPGVARCTGFMVAARVAVTAAHCLYGERLGHFVPAGSVHVLAGYAGGGFAAHALAVSYRIAPGFDHAHVGDTRGQDVAMVVLAQKLGTVLTLGEAPVAGQAVMLGGYSQDRAEVVEADPACTVTGVLLDRVGHALLAHDCTATRGTSGAPVLAHVTDGSWRVLGVEVGAFGGRPGGVAVPAATVRALLE